MDRETEVIFNIYRYWIGLRGREIILDKSLQLHQASGQHSCPNTALRLTVLVVGK